jgi:hypothetical protein
MTIRFKRSDVKPPSSPDIDSPLFSPIAANLQDPDGALAGKPTLGLLGNRLREPALAWRQALQLQLIQSITHSGNIPSGLGLQFHTLLHPAVEVEVEVEVATFCLDP